MLDGLRVWEKLDRIEMAVVLNNKNVLTLDEAVLFTGLSKSFLYKLTHLKKIPHSKPNGKLIYFNRIELEEWLLQNRISTTKLIEPFV